MICRRSPHIVARFPVPRAAGTASERVDSDQFSGFDITWKALPREPDPYYKYAGGFVGTFGQVYHVRFNIGLSRAER